MPVIRSTADLNHAAIRRLYDGFDSPIAALDCGKKCAPLNHGVPFCCDICHAVPAVYLSEWDYLQQNTDLWHAYRGDECESAPDPEAGRAKLEADTPASMILLACLGHTRCQRRFRSLACRQFPFYPYITADYRFLGLAYDWTFEGRCWVISNLEQVSGEYRDQFVRTFDEIFSLDDDEFEAYAQKSAEARAHFAANRRRVPVLHRDGGIGLVSPRDGRFRRIEPSKLPKFGLAD